MRKFLFVIAACAGLVPVVANAAPPKWAYLAHGETSYYYVDINNVQKISSNKRRIWANAIFLNEDYKQLVSLNEIDCTERSLSIINLGAFDKNGKVIFPGKKAEGSTSYPQPGKVNYTFLEFLCDGESLGEVTDDPVTSTMLRELMSGPN